MGKAQAHGDRGRGRARSPRELDQRPSGHSRLLVATNSNDARKANDVIDSQTVFVPKRIGWTVESTHPTPHRLTLRVPRPTTIGRIVLFSQGLRECDVDVLRGDEWRHAASAKPHDRVPCEVRLEPMAASAVRLTMAAFEGGFFQVYEVEGYEK